MVRAWWQGTARAAGAAVLAPASIVAAAGVIALGGGGLGSLSQLVTGPSLPGSSARSSTGERASGRTTAARVPLLAALPPSPGSAGAGGGAGGGGARRDGTGGGSGPTSGPGTERGGIPIGGGPPPGIPGGSAGHGNASGGAPTPPSAPAPLTQVGSAVKQIAAPLPEPVRSTINQLADTVAGGTGRARGG